MRSTIGWRRRDSPRRPDDPIADRARAEAPETPWVGCAGRTPCYQRLTGRGGRQCGPAGRGADASFIDTNELSVNEPRAGWKGCFAAGRAFLSIGLDNGPDTDHRCGNRLPLRSEHAAAEVRACCRPTSGRTRTSPRHP
jgi:hypothetical protein